MRADPHSYSDLDQARTESLSLELEVDFERRILLGRVRLRFTAPAVGTVDLDSRGLKIHRVVDEEGAGVGFGLDPTDPVLGERLRLELPSPTATLTIDYETGPNATGLMWLKPEQTDGGTHPFLLSQCQAIHARSLMPLQDTPRARITYQATIRVPAFATVVMSAAPGRVEPAGEGWRSFQFEMPQPIPPYLFALAVGELDWRDLGPRCRVYAEPGVVESAAWEFDDVERMLSTAEELFGPYRWDRYDFIVLPPSFPLGGMENPRMTFLTPTLLAGDRSLVGVLAHELAHSWTGNLVTNATNEDFWLNEGWTVWAERRILERLYGEEEAKQQAILGRMGLDRTLARRIEHGACTALTYSQQGLDPDGEFSTVPYEKGFLLITALERAVGRERFDRFVREYIDAFCFQSIDTDTFVDFARLHLDGLNGVDVGEWLHREGVPESAPAFCSDRLDGLIGLAEQGSPVSGADWSTTEKLVYLAHLPDEVDATAVASWLGLDGSANAELRSAWLALAVRTGVDGLEGQLDAFFDRVGRTKLLAPVLAEMGGRADLAALGQAAVARNAARWHSSTRGTLQRIATQFSA